MFIKFKNLCFAEDTVKLVKTIQSNPNGTYLVRVVTELGTYDIEDVPSDDIEVFNTCFLIRRRRYSSYADYRRSNPAAEPKEDPETITRYAKVNDEEEK